MNASYLVVNNSPRPTGQTTEDDSNYDFRQTVAKSNVMVPILWSSLYAEEDLVELESYYGTVLSPVTSLRKARLRWKTRRPQLEERFPHNLAELDGWEQAIAALRLRYIKVDVVELWMLGPADHERHLRSGIRWFDNGSDEDFNLMLDTLWMRGGYDSVTKAFTEDNIPYYFYGEPWKLPPLKANWGAANT